jgi:hypothetical protein
MVLRLVCPLSNSPLVQARRADNPPIATKKRTTQTANEEIALPAPLRRRLPPHVRGMMNFSPINAAKATTMLIHQGASKRSIIRLSFFFGMEYTPAFVFGCS